MENGKHKTNSFNSWSKKQSLLPSLQGGAGGRLSSLQGGAGGRLSPRQARLTHKKGVPSVSSVSSVSGVSFRFWTKKIARFWSKSEQNRCFKCFSCSKCSASLLPSFQGGAGGRLFPLTKCEAWLTLFYIGVLCDARFALTKIIPKKSVSKKVAIRR